MIETNYKLNGEPDSTTNEEQAVFTEQITNNITEKDLRSVQELPQRYHHMFQIFHYFNLIQSRTFDILLQTNKPLVVSAPTGSGKTILFELAIIRLIELSHNESTTDNKIVYMAPVKALCAERYIDWQRKFEPLGLQAIEVTGDSNNLDLGVLEKYNIILTTPEKWDSLTRRWHDYTALVKVIKLFLIDEVHLLSEEKRGPTLEAVVSRMKTVQVTLNPNADENNSIRFIAVSATIPNIGDIAKWLGPRGRPAIYFKFGEEMRPVHLDKVVIGYPSRNNITAFKFEMNLSYKIKQIVLKYSNGKPTLIFCTTRKGVLQTVSILLRDIAYQFSTEQRSKLEEVLNVLLDNKLKDAIKQGIGYHHAGMITSDRNHICELFRSGSLPILVATSTLAMGVNLPAHLVIIKSTEQYVGGEWVEYSEGQLLQMIGRAGRPQFDEKATAVIMTRDNVKHKYERLVAGKEMVESNLHRHMSEFLNAEIVLGTITDVYVAMNWISSTFLYVRVFANPRHYGIPAGLSKEETEAKLQALCMRELNGLEKYDLIVKTNFAYNFQPTDNGILMARYYIAFETMKIFMQVKGTETLPELLQLISRCHEFKEIQLRVNERGTLNMLNVNKVRDTIRFPISGRIKTKEMKVNCLIQATLGSLQIHDPSLAQEAVKVINIAQRLLQGFSRYLWGRDHYKSLVSALTLNKCVVCRLWDNSAHITRQLPGVGHALASLLASANKTTFRDVVQSSPRDLERITNRHPPFGNQLQLAAMRFPQYSLTIDYLPAQLKIVVTIKIVNASDLSETGGSDHKFNLIIGDVVNNKILKKETIHDTAVLNNGGEYQVYSSLKCAIVEGEIGANLISDDIVGVDVASSFKIPTNTKPKTIQTPIEMYGFKKKSATAQSKWSENAYQIKLNPYRVNLKQFEYEPAKVNKFLHCSSNKFDDGDNVTSSTQEHNEKYCSNDNLGQIKYDDEYYEPENNDIIDEYGTDILDNELGSNDSPLSGIDLIKYDEESHHFQKNVSISGALMHSNCEANTEDSNQRQQYYNRANIRHVEDKINVSRPEYKLSEETKNEKRIFTYPKPSNHDYSQKSGMLENANKVETSASHMKLSTQHNFRYNFCEESSQIDSINNINNINQQICDRTLPSEKPNNRQPIVLIPDDDAGCIEIVCDSDRGHSSVLTGTNNGAIEVKKPEAKFCPIFFPRCTQQECTDEKYSETILEADPVREGSWQTKKENLNPRKTDGNKSQLRNQSTQEFEPTKDCNNNQPDKTITEGETKNYNSTLNDVYDGSDRMPRPAKFGKWSDLGYKTVNNDSRECDQNHPVQIVDDNHMKISERGYQTSSLRKESLCSKDHDDDCQSDSFDTDFSPDLDTITSGYESLREFIKANEKKNRNANSPSSDLGFDVDTLLADAATENENDKNNTKNGENKTDIGHNSSINLHKLSSSSCQKQERNSNFKVQDLKKFESTLSDTRTLCSFERVNKSIQSLNYSNLKQVLPPYQMKDTKDSIKTDEILSDVKTSSGNMCDITNKITKQPQISNNCYQTKNQRMVNLRPQGNTKQVIKFTQESFSRGARIISDAENRMPSIPDIDPAKFIKSDVFTRPTRRPMEGGVSPMSMKRHKFGQGGYEIERWESNRSLSLSDRKREDGPYRSADDRDDQSTASRSLRSEYGDPFAPSYGAERHEPARDMAPSFSQLRTIETSKYFAARNNRGTAASGDRSRQDRKSRGTPVYTRVEAARRAELKPEELKMLRGWMAGGGGRKLPSPEPTRRRPVEDVASAGKQFYKLAELGRGLLQCAARPSSIALSPQHNHPRGRSPFLPPPSPPHHYSLTSDEFLYVGQMENLPPSPSPLFYEEGDNFGGHPSFQNFVRRDIVEDPPFFTSQMDGPSSFNMFY